MVSYIAVQLHANWMDTLSLTLVLSSRVVGLLLCVQAKQSMSRVYVLWKLLHKPSDGKSEVSPNWEDWLLGE